MRYRGTQHCIGKNTKYKNITETKRRVHGQFPPSLFVGDPDGAKINIK